MKRRSFLSMTLASFPLLAFAQTSSDKKGGGISVKAGEDRYATARQRPFGTSAFKVATKDTNGGLFVIEHRHTSKGGPPLHLHHGEDEWFYVLEGDYRIEIGGQRYKAMAGDSVLGPREVPHTWAYVGNTVGRMLLVYAPAGKMEDYFLERDKRGGALINDAAFLHAYGMELLGPPLKVE
jgi:mannose-6-phosphate isomerase-like protein (cupin superfamily)